MSEDWWVAITVGCSKSTKLLRRSHVSTSKEHIIHSPATAEEQNNFRPRRDRDRIPAGAHRTGAHAFACLCVCVCRFLSASGFLSGNDGGKMHDVRVVLGTERFGRTKRARICYEQELRQDYVCSPRGLTAHQRLTRQVWMIDRALNLVLVGHEFPMHRMLLLPLCGRIMQAPAKRFSSCIAGCPETCC